MSSLQKTNIIPSKFILQLVTSGSVGRVLELGSKVRGFKTHRKQFSNPCLSVLFQLRETGKPPDMTDKLMTIDQQRALKRDFVFNMIYSSREKCVRHLFIFTINYLTNTYI